MVPPARRAAASGSPSTSRRGSAPQSTTAVGSSARSARAVPALGEVGGEQQHAQAGAPQAELEGLGVDGLEPERGPGVEQQHALWPRGGRREPRGAVQPAGGPAARVLELGLAAGAAGGDLERGEEDLLERPLDRADGEALLELAVGGRLVEAVERGQQPRGRCRAAAAALGDLDRGRDVVGLAQRVAQRLDLVELVLAVVPRACGAAAGSRAGAPRCAGWRG